MKKIIVVFMIIFILNSTLLMAEDFNDYEKAAKEFEFENIKIGMSRESVKKIHNEISLMSAECDEKNSYIATLNSSKNASSIGCFYFENKLCEIRIVYKNNKLVKIGGLETIIDKLVNKFGNCNASDIGTNKTDMNAYWDFSSVSREIELTIKDEFVRIDVIDKDAMIKLSEKRKSGANVGF